MKYNDVSFLQDLKDYLFCDIERVNIFINNKIEFICYNFDKIFDIMNYIDYDKLNIHLIIQDVGYSLELYLKREEGEKNE